jgi:hypothetical protein
LVKRFLVLAALAVVAACGEKLDGGSCPVLCPEQILPVQEVVLDAVTLDTTLGNFPLLGTEPGLLLASFGDTLQTRGVARYDSLAKTYVENGTTKDITAVDSSRIFIRIDTTAVNFTGDVTLELYDVDTTATDTNTTAIAALFRPDRLLGSAVISRASLFLDDTLSIAIPNAYVLSKITGGGHVRIGFRMVGNGDLTLLSSESGLPPALKFDPAPGNTAVASRSIGPISTTPSTDLFLANDLRDFVVLVSTPDASTSERIAVGGLPALRAYLRLAIPSFYFDSVVVIRAQLVLVQKPVRGFADTAVATVLPVVVSSTSAITDLRRATQLTYPAFSFGVSALAAAPQDSGVKRIDIVQLFRQWAVVRGTKHPTETAIVLRGASEGRAPERIAFFGTDAPAELRPKLQLSFVARSRFGVP